LVLNNPTLSTENQLAVDYSIFPNPMMDQLTIQVGNNDMIKNMMVVDMNGKTLVTFKDVNSNYYVLNRNGLSAGTYMVHVTTQLGSFVHKIMLQ
jgi:roadblock/LC7 domain-containing protein